MASPTFTCERCGSLTGGPPGSACPHCGTGGPASAAVARAVPTPTDDVALETGSARLLGGIIAVIVAVVALGIASAHRGIADPLRPGETRILAAPLTTARTRAQSAPPVAHAESPDAPPPPTAAAAVATVGTPVGPDAVPSPDADRAAIPAAASAATAAHERTPTQPAPRRAAPAPAGAVPPRERRLVATAVPAERSRAETTGEPRRGALAPAVRPEQPARAATAPAALERLATPVPPPAPAAPPVAPAPVPEPGAAVASAAAAAAPPIEDAPRHAMEGFRRPRMEVPGCVQGAIRLPREVIDRIGGPVTVRFAVGPSGEVSHFGVLSDTPDRRVVEAIDAAVRSCRFVPGADAQGRPTRLWVMLPIRFAAGR